jgi:hypothetical protein
MVHSEITTTYEPPAVTFKELPPVVSPPPFVHSQIVSSQSTTSAAATTPDSIPDFGRHSASNDNVDNDSGKAYSRRGSLGMVRYVPGSSHGRSKA